MELVPTLAGIAIGAGIALAVPVNAVADDRPDRGPERGSGAMVQLTPVGDATERRTGTTDVALLIGVGAAGIAGGAGLFAAARHAARRAD